MKGQQKWRYWRGAARVWEWMWILRVLLTLRVFCRFRAFQQLISSALIGPFRAGYFKAIFDEFRAFQQLFLLRCDWLVQSLFMSHFCVDFEHFASKHASCLFLRLGAVLQARFLRRRPWGVVSAASYRLSIVM
jgi:hypothetical protein